MLQNGYKGSFKNISTAKLTALSEKGMEGSGKSSTLEFETGENMIFCFVGRVSIINFNAFTIRCNSRSDQSLEN